jgi:hypothetical protein
MYRHGDLLIEKIESIPESAKPNDDNIIVYGTTTGHAHKLFNGTVMEENGNIYLHVWGAGSVTHEEHNTIELPEGNYQVIRQIEYNPYLRVTRQVAD